MKNETPTLSALEAELARQDEALESFESTLTSLGDVELAIPRAFFDELEDVTSRHTTTIEMPFGIRV